jgi:hypothetical protein
MPKPRKKRTNVIVGGPEPKVRRPTKKAVQRELEKHFQSWACDFMEWHGWRNIRNNPVFAMTIGGAVVRSNEKGAPDNVFLYYFGTKQSPSAVCLVLWIEWKREGEDPDEHQIKWHVKERARGALIWVVEANREAFEKAYYENFGWLHKGDRARGQVALFAGLPEELLPV